MEGKRNLMTNEEVLHTLAKGFELIGENRAIILGNLDLEFVFMSKYYCKLIGVSQDIIGQQLRNSEHVGKKYATQLREIALKVMETRKTASYLVVYKLPNHENKHCYFNRASAVLNPVTHEVAGVMAEIELFNCKYIGQIMHLISEVNNVMKPSLSYEKKVIHDKAKYNLSQREEEILFLLMIGKSYKEIAGIINDIYKKSITPSAINAIIRNNLFEKFNVSSVSKLLEKVAVNNILKDVPTGLLNLDEGIFEVDFD